MGQNPDDPYGLGLRELSNDDDPYGLGLRPLDTPKKGFFQGLLDVPEELYNTVNTAGKNALGHINEGNYPAAFHDIAAPVVDPFTNLAGMISNRFEGKPMIDLPENTGERRLEGATQLAGAVGFPGQGFKEAYQAGDYPRIAGQAVGAAGTFYLGGKVNERLNRPIEPSRPRVVDEAIPPPPASAHPQLGTGEPPIVQGEPIYGDPRPPKPNTGPIIDGEIISDNPHNVGPEPPNTSANETGSMPPIVTLQSPDASTVAFYRNRGYVSVPGMRSPEGYIQMVRGDVAPLYGGQAASTSTNKGDSMPGGTTVHVDSSKVDTTFVKNMEEGGYKVSGLTNDGKTIFERFVSDESGQLDPEELWRNLRRMLGREPTIDELDAARKREPMEGERTGLVADFPHRPAQSTGKRQVYEIVEDLGNVLRRGIRDDPNVDTLINEAETQLMNETDSTVIEDNVRQLHDYAKGYSVNADEREIYGGLYDVARDALNRSRLPPDERLGAKDLQEGTYRPELPDFQRDRFGNVIQGGRGLSPEQLRDIKGPSINDRTDWGPGPDDPMWSENRGQVLPFRAQNQLENIANQDREIVNFHNQEDNQIRDYLKKEDGIPPEMRDLSDYAPKNFDPTTMHDEVLPALHRDLSEALSNAKSEGNVGLERSLATMISQIENEIARRNPNSPSEMRVPGSARGGGLDNIAVGGADPRVLDVLGTALYSRDRIATAVKELFQNSADERKISGSTDPIRIAFRRSAINPETGNDARSLVVKDFGRGMGPEDLYTVFTDVGKTGKGDVVGASGGFGFAKAAPLLGGDYVKVESVTIDPDTGDKMRYTFEGNPRELKNQKVGVPLNDELMDPSTPTGFKVEVFFPHDKYFSEASELIKGTVENTPGMTGVEIYDDYNDSDTQLNTFLETGTTRDSASYHHTPVGKATPSFRATIDTHGAQVDIHYDLDDIERKGGKLIILNNGLFALTDDIYYSQIDMPHVPAKVVANVRATVEEGEEGYPFTANRENLSSKLHATLKSWINDNLTKDAEKIRIDELQKVFDNLKPAKGTRHVIHDSGNRYSPDERARLAVNPSMNTVAQVMEGMLNRLHDLIPVGTAKGQQIGRTAKFGFLLADPGSGGLNIPSPKGGPNGERQYAILVNPFGLMTIAPTPRIGAEMIAHAILHEFNHNIVRQEGGGFTWQLLNTDAIYGTNYRSAAVDAIHSALTDATGNYAPGVQRLLQDYLGARGRRDTTVDTLARQRESEYLAAEGQGGVSDSDRTTGGDPAERARIDERKNLFRRFMEEDQGATPLEDIAEAWRKVKRTTGWGQGASKAGKQKPNEFNFIKEALAVPSAATTTLDLSAPGRQGLSQVLTPDFWVSGYKMFKGLSNGSFEQMERDLDNKEIWKKPIDLNTGKVGKSFGEEIGLKRFVPASKAGPRAEATASRWLETGGNIPYLSAGYRHTLGYPVRASNRAYITFLNQLATNRAEKLLNTARDMSLEALTTGEARPGFFKQKYSPDEAMDLNPYHNKVLGKEIADFVNTAIGSGPLKTHIIPLKQAEISLEAAAGNLNLVLFSPGLLASRMRMLNPSTYIMASPFVRKQYLKAAIGAAAGWFMMTQAIKMAAGDEAEVNDNPTSADFGKVRIGNTRLDAGGGFLQFLVAYSRMYSGGYTSSASGEYHSFGEGFQADTQEDMVQRFFVNKLNPVAKYVYDVLSASQYKPFHLADRSAQMFIPLFSQDLYELAKERPDLLPVLGPAALFGSGTQTYEKGESVSKFIAPEDDHLIQGGGGIQSIMPWNLGEEPADYKPFPFMRDN